MPKRRIHLVLEGSSIERGRRYCEMRGTTLSRLVDGFLASLPVGPADRTQLTPTVRRLLGIAATEAEVDIDDYHAHVETKYLG